MKIIIDPEGVWYHGSDKLFTELQAGSTITQWRALAAAFSHQPSRLCYEDDGAITHNGVCRGYLYAIDEPVTVGVDICQHPRTTMDENAEFLTKRALRVRLLGEA